MVLIKDDYLDKRADGTQVKCNEFRDLPYLSMGGKGGLWNLSELLISCLKSSIDSTYYYFKKGLYDDYR